MPSEAAISAHNVTKIYSLGRSGRTRSLPTIVKQRLQHPLRRGVRREKFRALDDVSFDVAPGEVVGVIGKNGAGKSTLLKILSRIAYPTDGYIDVVGRVGSLLEVGTGFHPELTGIENVYLNGAILGMSRQEIESRLDSIIDFAEVDKFLETPVKRYSSGMRVRLAFAVAAHLEPDVLIIDEVLSVGDASFQTKCLEKMRSIASDDGRTVLYVSHNLVTLENLCPRSMLLVEGRLAFDGDTQTTLSTYLNMQPHAESASAPGVFDLASVDRSEHKLAMPLFKRLELRPNGGAPADTVRMGDRLQVAIDVEGLDRIAEPNVSVVVGSASVDRLFRITCRMRPLRAAHERCRDETIVLDIPAMPLVPGAYFIKVAAYDLKDRALLDEVHRAAEFHVIPADIHGTAYQYSSRDGQIVLPWDWEIRPSTVDRMADALPAHLSKS
jgi:lipopolysaccharide transport system ATP-binding protein